MKGFSLVSTVAATFIFTAVGFALLVMSDEGFRITKSSINHNVAEANSEYALNAGIEHLLNGGECNNGASGSVNGGEWEYRLYPVSSNTCFIVAVGRKDNGVRYKIAFVGNGGGGKATIGALTVNDFNGRIYIMGGWRHKKISNGGTDCPAFVYSECRDNECNIDRYVYGEIVDLDEPIDIQEILFKEGIALEDLKDYFRDEYDYVLNNVNIPSEPIITTDDCIIETSYSSCTIENKTITCGNGQSKDISACGGIGVKIKGEELSVNIKNADLQDTPIVIEANKVNSVKTDGNSTINSLYVNSDEFGSLSTDGSTKIITDIVIKSDTLCKNENCIRFSGNTEIKGSVFMTTRNGDLPILGEKAKVILEGSTNIRHNLYFLGYKLDLEYTGGSKIGGDIYIKTYDGYEISLQHYGDFVAGGIYANCESENCEGEVEIKNGNLRDFNKRFLFLSNGKELEVEVESGSGIVEGYFVNLSDEGRVKLEVEHGGITAKGVFIADEISFEKALKGSNRVEGILIANKIKDIKMKGNAKIYGLLALLDYVNSIVMKGSSAIYGTVMINQFNKALKMGGNSLIFLHLDRVNRYINEFGLSDYLNTLTCEASSGGSGGVSIPQGLVGSVF